MKEKLRNYREEVRTSKNITEEFKTITVMAIEQALKMTNKKGGFNSLTAAEKAYIEDICEAVSKILGEEVKEDVTTSNIIINVDSTPVNEDTVENIDYEKIQESITNSIANSIEEVKEDAKEAAREIVESSKPKIKKGAKAKIALTVLLVAAPVVLAAVGLYRMFTGKGGAVETTTTESFSIV